MFGIIACLANCTDKTVVSYTPGSHDQATIDSLQTVVDSITAERDSLAYELCVTRLVSNERKHSLNCVREWLTGQGIGFPSDCNGRPIDLTECEQ
jgi:hypothetical protein